MGTMPDVTRGGRRWASKKKKSKAFEMQSKCRSGNRPGPELYAGHPRNHRPILQPRKCTSEHIYINHLSVSVILECHFILLFIFDFRNTIMRKLFFLGIELIYSNKPGISIWSQGITAVNVSVLHFYYLLKRIQTVRRNILKYKSV